MVTDYSLNAIIFIELDTLPPMNKPYNSFPDSVVTSQEVERMVVIAMHPSMYTEVLILSRGSKKAVNR